MVRSVFVRFLLGPMIDKPEPRRFPPPWSVNDPDSKQRSVSSLTCAVAHGVFHRSASVLGGVEALGSVGG